jgi:hypothetical protein
MELLSHYTGRRRGLLPQSCTYSFLLSWDSTKSARTFTFHLIEYDEAVNPAVLTGLTGHGLRISLAVCADPGNVTYPRGQSIIRMHAFSTLMSAILLVCAPTVALSRVLRDVDPTVHSPPIAPPEGTTDSPKSLLTPVRSFT